MILWFTIISALMYPLGCFKMIESTPQISAKEKINYDTIRSTFFFYKKEYQKE